MKINGERGKKKEKNVGVRDSKKLTNRKCLSNIQYYSIEILCKIILEYLANLLKTFDNDEKT